MLDLVGEEVEQLRRLILQLRVVVQRRLAVEKINELDAFVLGDE